MTELITPTPATTDTVHLNDASLDETEGLTGESVSPTRQALRRFRKNRVAMVAFGLLVFLVLVVVFSGLTTRYGVNQPVYDIKDQKNQFLSPRADAWFGTDDIGRDIYSRIIFGVRVSLIIGLISSLAAVIIGTLVGATAGYLGGIFDDILMRVTDIFLAFPFIIALLVIRQMLGAVGWITNIMGKPDTVRFIVILLALLGWMGVARVVRGQVKSLKEREFVEAARALGATGPRIVIRNILPNAIAPILVALTLGVVGSIVAESTLAVFGYGPKSGAGNTSLGLLVRDSKTGVQTGYWWMTLFPCLALTLVALTINFVGDGLRDATDPKATQGRA